MPTAVRIVGQDDRVNTRECGKNERGSQARLPQPLESARKDADSNEGIVEVSRARAILTG